MRNVVVALICALLLVLFAGCGGGGGGSDDGGSDDGGIETVQDVSAIGLWTGSLTDGDGITYDITGVISPDNDICLYSFEWGLQFVGSLGIDGDVATGSITGYAPEGYLFANGDSITTGTFEMDIVEESSITGTYSTSGDSGSFNLQYLPDLENPTSSSDAALSDAAGMWVYYNSTDDWAEFTINQHGTITGVDNWGCQFQGTISVMDLDWRIFYVTITASECSPYDGDYSGLMIIDADGYLWSMITSSEYSVITKLEPKDGGWINIPDTGQTTSYTDTFGEDSDYEINPPSYTKLDASGNDLDDSATDWVMVRDSVTGLVWEVKTDDDSIHDKDNSYSWQDAQDIFIAQLNSDSYGGYSDWRLPTIKELSTLVLSETYSPAINTTYFPNTAESSYLSFNTTNTAYTDVYSVLALDFAYGRVDNDSYTTSFRVRAVRGGSQRDSTFIDNGDLKTVTDYGTGLMWQMWTADLPLTWEEALEYCENLELAGYDDWRLPNRNELHSITDYEAYDYNAADPAIDQTFFPGYGNSMSCWTSTTYSYNTENAWSMGFYNGTIGQGPKTGAHYVKAVRGGTGELE